jgi:hypothetical protein
MKATVELTSRGAISFIDARLKAEEGFWFVAEHRPADSSPLKLTLVVDGNDQPGSTIALSPDGTWRMMARIEA